MKLRFLSIFTVVVFMTTTCLPVPRALASDGWVVMDAADNVVSQSGGSNQTNIQVFDNGAYRVLNGDIGLNDTVNISVLNAEGIADASAKAIFNFAGGDASVWEGTLNVFGTVAFVNTAGFDIASSFQGNIEGGAIISSLAISQADFANGIAELSRDLSAEHALVSNKGAFNVAQNSFLALVGSAVQNQGPIAANGGAVVLAGGEQVKLDLTGGEGLISVEIKEAVDAPVYDFEGNKISDQVANSGAIQANGGVAILSAKAVEGVFDRVVNHTGIIEANTMQEVNGRILLTGSDHGIVQVAGELYAKGDDVGETGGEVHVLGEKVGLYAEADVDASGYAGGGTILVGGDYQGLGEVQNSELTYVDPNAKIKADALLEGDGGKIIVWANQAARVYGTLSARGGVLGGNGGLIETSSKGFIDTVGIKVDANAPAGENGSWLIDPHNAVLDNFATNGGSFSGGNPNVFTPTADDSKVNIVDVQNSLNDGTDVTITTGATGDQEGNVSILAPILKSLGGNAILKIIAASDIELKATASIISTTGALGIFFEAGRQIILRNIVITNGGDVTLNAVEGIRLAEAEADIQTGGGAFTADANTNNDDVGTFFTNGASALSGGAAINTEAGAVNITGRRLEINGAVKTTAGDIFLTAARGFLRAANEIRTQGGQVTLNAKDGIDLNTEFADIRTSGGTLNVNANTDNDNLGEFNQNDAGSVIRTDAGDITVFGRQVGLTGTMRTTTGNVQLTAGQGAVSVHNTLSTVGGNVAVNATNGINLDTASSDVTTQGGSFQANANTDDDTSGVFSQSNAGSVINTNNGTVTVSGRDIDLDGSVRSGTGTQMYTANRNFFAAGTLETGGADIDINADANAHLNGPTDIRTAGGKFTMTADADNDGAGDLFQSDALSIVNSAGGAVALSGENVDLDGTIRSGAGTLSVTAKSGNVSVSNELITENTMLKIEATENVNFDGPTNIRTNGGDFSVRADSDASGAGNVFQSDGLSVIATSGGKIDIEADKVDLDGALRSGAGDMTITANGGNVSVSNELMTEGAELNIQATENVNFDGPTNIRTNGGNFSAKANSDASGTGNVFQSDGLSVIATSGGKLEIEGRKADLDGALRSGAGNMTITANDGDVFVSNELITEGAELNIQATKDVNLDGPTNVLTNGGKFTATADSDNNSVGDIFQSDTDSLISTSGGNVFAEGANVDLDGTLRSGAGTMSIEAKSENVFINKELATSGSDLTIKAANDINLDGPADIRTGGGKFTATADSDNSGKGDFIQASELSVVNSEGGNLSVQADKVDLEGTIKSGIGTFSITATGGLLNSAGSLESQGTDLFLSAAHGINLDGPGSIRTNGGNFKSVSDSDNNGQGDFFQSDATHLINTDGGDLEIKADKVDLEGTLKSGAGTFSITATGGFLNSAGHLESQGTDIVLNAINGVALDGPGSILTNGGALKINANTDDDNSGGFNQSDASHTMNTGGGEVTLIGRDANLSGTLKSEGAKVTITGTRGAVSISNLVETSGADLEINAANGIQFTNSEIRTTGGDFKANANSDDDNDGDFNQTNEASLLNTGGGLLEITARAIGIQGTLQSETGDFILNATFGSVTVGSNLLTSGANMLINAANGISFTDTQIRTEGGNFTANADSNNDGDGDFNQLGSTSVINAGDPLNVPVGGNINATGREVNFEGTVITGDGDISVEATVRGVRMGNEVTTLGGKVDIKAADSFRLLSDDADIRSNGGDIEINANTNGDADGVYFAQDGGSLVDTGGGSLSITANDFNMNGTHRADGNRISLFSANPGMDVNLGYTTRTDGEVNIKGGEAQRIFADTLFIGGPNAGDFHVGEYSPINVNTLILETGGRVIEEGLGDPLTDVTVPNLAIHSVTGVNLDTNVDVLAIQNDGFGDINIQELDNLTIGDVDIFSGVTTLGGNISIVTGDSLIVGAPVVNLGGGIVTLAALGILAADSLSILANIIATGGDGDIRLIAGNNILFGSDIVVKTSGDGDILLKAGATSADEESEDKKKKKTDTGKTPEDTPPGVVVIPPDAQLNTENGAVIVA